MHHITSQMLSIFYFSYWFCNDIGSLWASLKKGTRLYSVGCPEFGETHSPKTRLPVLGTSTQMFRWKHSVGCPYFGKTHFPKTRLPEIGTVARHFVQIMWIFLLGVFYIFLFLYYLRAYMMCINKLSKSSAIYLVRVEFSQKCFVDLIFGHRFLSIFLKFCRVLCKLISKSNKFNLHNSNVFMWA